MFKYIYDDNELKKVLKLCYQKYNFIITGANALGYDTDEQEYTIYTDSTQYSIHTPRLK